MINVLDYGIISSNEINQTAKLQKIIDDAQAGEIIYVPASTEIVIASLRLKSNISINLESSSKLIASPNYCDYECWTSSEQYKGEPMYAMIYAKHGENIKIYGNGTIDGNGKQFVSESNKYIYKLDRYPRITMLFFENITDLTIDEITIRNGCFWTIHPVGCKNIKFRGLNILQDLKMPNCDGIDPDHCKNVIISDCIIESADDCIVLKNTEYFENYGSTSNVVVTGCILKSTSAGFKVGTESYGDFKNICFSNSIINESNRGVSIQLRDGGNLSNMLVSNVIINTRKFDNIWWGKGEPIAITSFQRNQGSSNLSTIKNVKFNNLTLESENAIYISSQKEGLIKNISLNQIDFCLTQKTKWTEHFYDDRPLGGEHVGLYKGPLAGIYLNNVDVPQISDLNFESDITEIKVFNTNMRK